LPDHAQLWSNFVDGCYSSIFLLQHLKQNLGWSWVQFQQLCCKILWRKKTNFITLISSVASCKSRFVKRFGLNSMKIRSWDLETLNSKRAKHNESIIQSVHKSYMGPISHRHVKYLLNENNSFTSLRFAKDNLFWIGSV
jgi:hypothetical protein